MEVTVLGLRQDVELLPAVWTMAVPNEAKLFEDVQRSIHG